MRGLVKTVLGDLGVISCLLDLHIFWSRATRSIACSDHSVFALFRNLVGNLSCRTPLRTHMNFG
jgi:S-adenosylmethionine:diacylglycerol 3-amino-3-carboxypropyl transferase